MLLLSCVNCCFNALQYDTLGTSFGYCVEHRCVLRNPEALTCGRHFRKDLAFPSARRESDRHEGTFSRNQVSFLRRNGATPRNAGYLDSGLSELASHSVTGIVMEYGEYGAKIESLARLSKVPGVRAEVARLSLSRTYVARCVSRGGQWTSGIHLYWWTCRQLLDEPDVRPDDIRVELAISLERQIELAKWAVLMLRLVFMSDIGHHANGDNRRVGSLGKLAERAAMATRTVSFGRLHRWVRREGKRIAEHALSRNTYIRLARELHEEHES